ncbi:hypothetical protein MAXJ12_19932 [Mesorhizobium alhagi CCNWXJ12-2]|uniref:Uncharacterized protein n=1 Tax=Mesorhizobium alhagi CCNWXJ12-2 TaxID=1107882 RepID=H0HUY3_9HYPH|nr:hypothetical protein MAXJ12_19932 [Mesorhizobium alhagi CCNWXJ12-2]
MVLATVRFPPRSGLLSSIKPASGPFSGKIAPPAVI